MRAQRRRVLAAGIAGLAGAAFGAWVFAQPGGQVIRVVARKFVFLPNEITLKKGVPAVLEFTAPEVVMGFSVPELKVRTDIIPGQVARLRMVPDRAGTFDFLCDIFCGEGHEGMSGKLHVVA
ncbi:MAG: cupredoxin domain-containing protein [Burkholderiales bacterium]